MNIDKINEIKEKAIAEIEAVVKEVTKPKGRWKPTNGESYYFIMTNGKTCSGIAWDVENSPVDIYRYQHGNVFNTRKIADRYNEIDIKIREIASRDPVDWSDLTQSKYFIYMTVDSGGIEQSWPTICFSLNEICSSNPDFKDILCAEIGEENLIWFFKMQRGIIRE